MTIKNHVRHSSVDALFKAFRDATPPVRSYDDPVNLRVGFAANGVFHWVSLVDLKITSTAEQSTKLSTRAGREAAFNRDM